ncbi:hypothetical protein NMG60_11006499 [Bertholletia excelsa]
MEPKLTSSSSGSEVQEERSDNGSISHEEGKREEELEVAKAKMHEVREENTRLKVLLEQIEKDYHSLQMRFIDSIQKPSVAPTHEEEEPELVCLSLGRRSPCKPKTEHNPNTNSPRETIQEPQSNSGLKLGLDYEAGPQPDSPSPENSLEEITKEEQPGETWPPSKALKTMGREDQEEVPEQASVKRARVSVRARCDTPTMNDGCQWRKYGQKIAKGNPCPRAYYRCTVAPACPVRKQVQRCAEDMSILITTYEGTHNHPLPVSATAMASTTSAAASMLISGSSASSTPSATTNLHGLNFSLANNISTTRPFYIPNSTSQPFPTITLDLTSSSSNSPHFSIFSSAHKPSFPSSSLCFSSSDQIQSNMLPTLWGSSGYSNFGTLPYNKSNPGTFSLGRPTQEQFYTDKNNQASSQQLLTETLTKAITSDPSFRSVIAAAISSMVADSGGNQGGVDSSTRGQNVKACVSSYLGLSSALNSQNGGLKLLQQPPQPFSISKDTSASGVDARDQIN